MIGRCGMKFNYCQKIRFFFVISCVLATATQAFAQDADDIWAYRSTGKTVAENNDLDQITDHLREAKTLVALCKEKLGKTNEDINKLLDQ